MPSRRAKCRPQPRAFKGAAEGAKVKTAQAANNVDVNIGSAVNVQASERETNVLNTETVLNNAEQALAKQS